MIGCDCAVCSSDDPKNKRLRSSLWIRTEKTSLAVDTGPDFRQQCLREGIRHLDAVLFTHAHSDHLMGFDDLRRFTIAEDSEMPIYATESCLERLRAAFSYVFDGKNRYRGYLKTEPHPVRGAFRIGEFEVEALPVDHGKVETVGFLFSSEGHRLFAYLPDMKSLHPESRERLQGIGLLIIDGLQPEGHRTHLSVSEAVTLAREVNARQTWLTHFSCRMDYRVIEPSLPKNVHLAWDGLCLQC